MSILSGEFLTDINHYKHPYFVKLLPNGVEYSPVSPSNSAQTSSRNASGISTTPVTSVDIPSSGGTQPVTSPSLVGNQGDDPISALGIVTPSSVTPKTPTSGESSQSDAASPSWECYNGDHTPSSPGCGSVSTLRQVSETGTSASVPPLMPASGGTIAKRRTTKFLHVSAILGCDCQKGRNSTDRAVYFVIYAYPRPPVKQRKPSGGERQTIPTCRKRETLTLKFGGLANADDGIRDGSVAEIKSYEENYKEAARWMITLTCLLRGAQINPLVDLTTLSIPLQSPRLLVLVNPFSGPGEALEIFQKRVRPMFAQARLDYHLVVTERAGHARELVQHLKLDDWQGIVIVSGDGLLFEVVNGLMERPDLEQAIKMPLGVIPGGSGNALACAVCYHAGEPYLEKHALHSSFVVAKHDVFPMDLVAVDTAAGKRLYSFLSVGWGMMADVDIESEKYRNIGNARFALMAVIKILSLKKYAGRLSYLPAPTTDTGRGAHSTFNSGVVTTSYAQENDTTTAPRDSDSQTHPHGALSPFLPPLDQPLPSTGWITIEDEFILIGGVYQSHLAKDNLMTPDATFNDGVIHLVFVRGACSRVGLIRMFTALEEGLDMHDDSLDFEVVRVLAFRLKPHTEKGLMTVDGELVDYGPLQAQVLPGMARIMSLDKKYNQ